MLLKFRDGIYSEYIERCNLIGGIAAGILMETQAPCGWLLNFLSFTVA